MEAVQVETKIYKRRWFILFLFVMYAAANAMQWLEYCIITNIIERYYNISAQTVNWTSLVTMVTYPPLLIPGTYIIDKMGLRTAALAGALGTAAGTWIKVFSLRPDLFWVTFLGQTVVFISQIFILSLPPKIASVWFPEDEVSRACGIGIFGQQFGTAVGFLIPPLLVKNHDNIHLIGEDLAYLFYGAAIFTTAIAILVVIYFKAKPPLPPSQAQVIEHNGTIGYSIKDLCKSYKVLLTHKPFMIHSLSFGMNVGVFIGLGTVLNQVILSYFENSVEDAGLIGMIMTIVGMVGSVLFGYILDKTRKYKAVNVGIYILSGLGLIGFMFSLETYSKTLVYLTGSIMGFFSTSYYPVALEMGVELTFPQPESTSAGILVTSGQLFGIVIILSSDSLLKLIGTFWFLVLNIGSICIGLVFTIVTPNILNRQAAFNESKQVKDIKFAVVPTCETKW